MLPATKRRSKRLQVLFRIAGSKIFQKLARKYRRRSAILMKLQILNSLHHVLFPRGFFNISKTVVPQSASTQLHLKALLAAKGRETKQNYAQVLLNFRSLLPENNFCRED